ncbi:hypothetical protein TGDOM2_359890, partial [Toxoplasma gondii GAB2-2007-GAL-DOM2]
RGQEADCSAALQRLQQARLQLPERASSALPRRRLGASSEPPLEAPRALQGQVAPAGASLEAEQRPQLAPEGQVSSERRSRSRRPARRQGCSAAGLPPRGQLEAGAFSGIRRRQSPPRGDCLEPSQRRARARPGDCLEPNRRRTRARPGDCLEPNRR